MQIRRALLWAVSTVALGVAAPVQAAQTPVFQYSFPASWPGSGTAVTDLSAAGNNGTTNATLALSSNVPPGATGGTQSVTTSAGAMVTNATQSLANPTVAAAGGFQYNVAFMWDGTDSSSFSHTEKIVDYAGTESLQLTTTSGSAALQLRFDDTTNVLSTNILPNIWYQVQANFDTGGNAVAGDGSLAGLASMAVTDLTDAGSPVVVGPAAATKTGLPDANSGDGLNRGIGVGELGSPFGYLVGFHGQIYNPSVTLVPEPASLGLLCAAVPLLCRRRRAARA